MRPFLGIGVLSRYLIRQNLFLMIICLAVGTCIYLLSDVFDRLDDFIRAGLGVETILFYFLVKIPVIVSQLMPAIFLLAMVIQMGVFDPKQGTSRVAGGRGVICVAYSLFSDLWPCMGCRTACVFSVSRCFWRI